MSEGLSVGGIFAELKLDASNFSNDIERAKAAIKLMDAEVERLKMDVKSGAIGLDTYAEQMNQIVTATNTLRGSMTGASAASINLGRAALAPPRSVPRRVTLDPTISMVPTSIPATLAARTRTARAIRPW